MRGVQRISLPTDAERVLRGDHAQIRIQSAMTFHPDLIALEEAHVAHAESLIAWRVLRAQKSHQDGMIAPDETKRLQFVSMSVHLQNGEEKRQHDCRIDERRRRLGAHTIMVWQNRIAK